MAAVGGSGLRYWYCGAVSRNLENITMKFELRTINPAAISSQTIMKVIPRKRVSAR